MSFHLSASSCPAGTPHETVTHKTVTAISTRCKNIVLHFMWLTWLKTSMAYRMQPSELYHQATHIFYKDNANGRNENHLSNYRVQLILLQKYNKNMETYHYCCKIVFIGCPPAAKSNIFQSCKIFFQNMLAFQNKITTFALAFKKQVFCFKFRDSILRPKLKRKVG